MNINTKHIYISFTTFTMLLFIILYACKYCKYEKIDDKTLAKSVLCGFLWKITFTRPFFINGSLLGSCDFPFTVFTIFTLLDTYIPTKI